MVQVIKATGEKEPFSENKVRISIKRAGLPNELEEKILEHVRSKLYENIPTSEIYSHITEFLDQTHHSFDKSKYSLKQAIMGLGPTGYPFEGFISRLLEKEGYQTEIDKILQGKCVSHEIDVLAEKDGRRIAIEVKYHNLPGTRTDIHVALYTKARFDDVKEKNNIQEVWLMTNTKATTDAIDYSNCVGMKIISWSYPANDSLRDLIEKYKLFPISAISTLSQSHKQQLLEQKIILCEDILKNPASLDILTLPNDKKENVLSEAKFICS